jgi:hypothetical protein
VTGLKSPVPRILRRARCVQRRAPSVLADRLRERRVPDDLVTWIGSFCNGRKASVVVGDYESPISEIEHAGIPQWSPLSPILYVFYNAKPRAGPHQQERRLHRLHRRLQRLGDGAECSREHAQAADATATKGQEVGAGGWRDFRSRQDGLVVAAACSVKII